MSTVSAQSETPRFSELTPRQWRSGMAAWFGWLFDGVELHIYTLVATPLVVQLLGAQGSSDPGVKEKSAYIQASFLIGWALGGAFFGRLGDRLGRSRALSLTVLTYALCTGLCAFSQTWWQLMGFRFLAALGIGGEWAVGAALISETWPKSWRPWLAAALQSGVNIGVLATAAIINLLSALPRPPAERYLFLIGVLPAFLVFWIRRKVPEPDAWTLAKGSAAKKPRLRDLFSRGIARTTLNTAAVSALSLSAWWLFLFWNPQHQRRLLELAGASPSDITRKVSASFFLLNAVSILGNFGAGWLAKKFGNRLAIMIFIFGLFAGMAGAYIVPRSFSELAWGWCPLIGFFAGVFGLFTMYLPPLFPTLLRTTGAGFCYNIGRIAAGVASVIFGWAAPVGNFRNALLISSLVALAGSVWAWWLPESPHGE